MQIKLPNDQEEPTTDPRGPLGEEELRESAAQCEQANAEIAAGTGRDAREAMMELGRELRFQMPGQNLS